MFLPLPQLPTVGLGEVEVVGSVCGEGWDVAGEGNGIDVFDVVLHLVQVDPHLTDRQAQVIEVRVRPADCNRWSRTCIQRSETQLVTDTGQGALQRIFFSKNRDYYGSGWVGPGLLRIFFFKSSQNSPKPVLIFWTT